MQVYEQMFILKLFAFQLNEQVFFIVDFGNSKSEHLFILSPASPSLWGFASYTVFYCFIYSKESEGERYIYF